MVSGVSILNFSALRKRFSLIRSNIGLRLLLGLKKQPVEEPQGGLVLY